MRLRKVKSPLISALDLFRRCVGAAIAFSELGRGPHAYLARTHSSAAWRNGSVAGVIVLGFITAFNLFMPFNQGLRERIAAPQGTGAVLEEVEATPANLREEVALTPHQQRLARAGVTTRKCYFCVDQ